MGHPDLVSHATTMCGLRQTHNNGTNEVCPRVTGSFVQVNKTVGVVNQAPPIGVVEFDCIPVRVWCVVNRSQVCEN